MARPVPPCQSTGDRRGTFEVPEENLVAFLEWLNRSGYDRLDLFDLTHRRDTFTAKLGFVAGLL